MTSQPQTTADRDMVAIDDLRETDGSRLTEIDPDHVENLEESIELEGLIEPIVVTSSPSSEYAYDIVDGRHRKRALERIGVEEVAVYAMPGERDYAVPTREAEVDVDIQSMAANVLRKEQTQAEAARFLKDNIKERIISNFTDEELNRLGNNADENYASARVPRALQLLDHLENIENEHARKLEDLNERLWDKFFGLVEDATCAGLEDREGSGGEPGSHFSATETQGCPC